LLRDGGDHEALAARRLERARAARGERRTPTAPTSSSIAASPLVRSHSAPELASVGVASWASSTADRAVPVPDPPGRPLSNRFALVPRAGAGRTVPGSSGTADAAAWALLLPPSVVPVSPAVWLEGEAALEPVGPAARDGSAPTAGMLSPATLPAEAVAAGFLAGNPTSPGSAAPSIPPLNERSPPGTAGVGGLRSEGAGGVVPGGETGAGLGGEIGPDGGAAGGAGDAGGGVGDAGGGVGRVGDAARGAGSTGAGLDGAGFTGFGFDGAGLDGAGFDGAGFDGGGVGWVGGAAGGGVGLTGGAGLPEF
jgi:hypothetical protein